MLVGIVGKANVGKSTFFKAATLADVLIANYPFATIKPNHGMAYVKVKCIDSEFKTQCMPRTGYCVNHIRFVPVELMDVAGLVPGASEGKGLGNQFLDDLRQADCFIQIVDASGGTTIEGKPCEPGSHDPCEDIIFLEKELDLWYLGILKKVWRTFSRTLSLGKDSEGNFSKQVAKQFSGLKIDENDVKQTILKTKLDTGKAEKWTDEELLLFVKTLRKLTKPMIIAANKCDFAISASNIEKMKEKFDYMIVPCSADSELALREASKHGLIDYIPGEKTFSVKEGKTNEKQKMALENIKKNVLEKYEFGTGVQEILDESVFKLLKYIALFPAGVHKLADSKGNILPDCFLLPEGSTALDFAFSLHTDIGNNFVKAIDARTGKALGKDHVLKHRDALEIATK